MKRPSARPRNRPPLWMNLVLAALPVVLFLIAAEIFFIWRFDFLEGGLRRNPYPAWLEADPELMWRPKANVRFDYEERSANGMAYPVHYATFKDGFREWGDLHSPRKKIFVIGDSFTMAHQVSNDKTYYHLLGAALDAEIFAFGSDAYNSVQEWMILKRYVDTIKPDWILWQFCDNDLLNNDGRIPFSMTYASNFSGRQPFLEHGKIVYHEQEPVLRFLFAVKRHAPSRFLYFLATRTISALIGDPIHGSRLRRRSPDDIQRGALATEEIFREVRAAAGRTPVYLFSANEDDFLTVLLKKISEENHFHFIAGIRAALLGHQRLGEVFLMSDRGHWNERGHAIAADVILQALMRSE